eukprot:104001-Rhodomonas_salina.2
MGTRAVWSYRELLQSSLNLVCSYSARCLRKPYVLSGTYGAYVLQSIPRSDDRIRQGMVNTRFIPTRPNQIQPRRLHAGFKSGRGLSLLRFAFAENACAVCCSGTDVGSASRR